MHISRPVAIGVALIFAGLISWRALQGFDYLREGYSLAVGMPGEPGSIFHIDFPAWRVVAHVLLWFFAATAIAIFLRGHRSAAIAAWVALIATVTIGVHDISQYGTLGSPTSIWTILLLFSFALVAKYLRQASEEEA